MNWSLGFGLERLGLLALKFPKLTTIVVLATLFYAGFALKNLQFDGNIVNVLDTDQAEFSAYTRQAEEFHDYTKDVVVILQNQQLTDPVVIEAFRDLHLELTLDDNVESIYSLFTVGDAGMLNEDTPPLIPVSFSSAAEVKQSLRDLLEQQPATRSILALEANALLMVVTLQADILSDSDALAQQLLILEQTIDDLVPDDTSVAFAGMPHIEAAIVEAIISDQTLLTGTGIAFGCLIAWFIFGTVRSAVICTVPAFVAVTWTLTVFATTETSLSFFSTALPSLALIIAFADTIVLYFRWQALLGDTAGETSAQSNLHVESIESTARQHQITSLKRAIREVGPASSLTSITTALAFGSFTWAANPTMTEFGFLGVAAVILAFLGVIICLPICAYWAITISQKPAHPKSDAPAPPRFTQFGSKIATLVTLAPRGIACTAVIIIALFTWAQTHLSASYTLADYFPKNSQIETAESITDELFGGTAQYHVVLPVTSDGEFNDPENRGRLTRLHEAISAIVGEGRTLSLATAWSQMDDEQINDLPQALEEAPEALRGKFLSDDYRLMQVSANTSASSSTRDLERPIAQINAAIETLEFRDEVQLTGLRALMAKVFPELIDQLRNGLLVSIFLAVLVLAVATRSGPLALASLVPNLIPILFAQSAIWFWGGSLSVSNIIALTIAFGISVDNAIHVINAYQKLDSRVGNLTQRIKTAVTEIAPALLASTCIICVAAIITQFSSMPMVNELGLLLIGTLIIALISNLTVLPSMMYLLLKLKPENGSAT